MTLLLRLVGIPAAGYPPTDVEVAAREWVSLAHPDPQGLVAGLAGVASGGEGAHGGVVLAGEDLTARPAADRARAGFATCGGLVPDLPGLRVLDVLLLARPVRLRGASLRAVLGSRRARAVLADEEAAVRVLAGRMGLAAWVDAEAVGLPPAVAAATDLVRALAGAPRALVWAVPDTASAAPPASDEPAAGALAAALAAEQERFGFAVVAVGPTGPLGAQ